MVRSDIEQDLAVFLEGRRWKRDPEIKEGRGDGLIFGGPMTDSAGEVTLGV